MTTLQRTKLHNDDSIIVLSDIKEGKLRVVAGFLRARQ